MRLLRAELAKLARPLSLEVAAAAALFCLLLAAGGSHNAVLDAQGAPRHLPSCAAEQVPAGPQCSRWQAAARVRLRQIQAEPAQVAGQLAPAAAGAEAAGLIASLPGALAIALLAGAHIGGEWSGWTMKSLLTQLGHQHLPATASSPPAGRRWRWPGRCWPGSTTCPGPTRRLPA